MPDKAPSPVPPNTCAKKRKTGRMPRLYSPGIKNASSPKRIDSADMPYCSGGSTARLSCVPSLVVWRRSKPPYRTRTTSVVSALIRAKLPPANYGLKSLSLRALSVNPSSHARGPMGFGGGDQRHGLANQTYKRKNFRNEKRRSPP